MKRILFFIFLLAGCGLSADYSHIKVIEVIDGDTVRLANGKLLRYIGVDTPELSIKQNGIFLHRPQPYAVLAQDANRALVEDKFVRVDFDIERVDRYGRMLGYCYADGIFVNARLIEDGFATLFTRPPNVKHVDTFITAQEHARENKRGLWGALEVVSSRDASGYINQIRTVRGRVLDVYQSRKCIYLNFDKDYKTDFTVVIFNDCISLFEKEGIDPYYYYRGKTIEVTGRIREYNGPEIIVGVPAQIVVYE